jgi:hypothetical protein
MTKISFDTPYVRNCPKCNTELFYNNTSALNLAIREKKVCRSCSKKGKLQRKNHPDFLQKKCEKCSIDFETPWKSRNQRFCSIQCMYEWRKSESHEIVKCLNCGNEFERYKTGVHSRTGIKQRYCSNNCNRTSNEKREKLKKWANSDKNPRKDPAVQRKVRKTKLEKYGDENYNNTEKNISTMMERYGVPYSLYLPHVQSAGKTISNGQRQLFELIKRDNPDSILEHYLPDVGISVDIFIPSKNEVVEYLGDYWHCNPKKYKSDFYNKNVHKTAEEIWKGDADRIQLLRDKGYTVKIVWESDFKKSHRNVV